MNITERRFLSTLAVAAFMLMAALSMGMAGTGDMAGEPGIKTVTFGVA